MAIGGIGGGIGLIIVLAVILLGGDPGDLSGLAGESGSDAQTNGNAARNIDEECRTGLDATEQQDCRIVAYVNSIQAYWTEAYDDRDGQYTMSQTVLFSDLTQTACGTASSQVGPFYCPSDQQIYLDLGFFDELRSRFGAEGGPIAEAYVLAHEYGHHVQNQQGILGQSSQGKRPTERRRPHRTPGRLLRWRLGQQRR